MTVEVKIDERILSDDLQIPGVKNLPTRAVGISTTLGGRGYICSLPIVSGNQIRLTSELDGDWFYGRFSTADVDFFNDLKTSGDRVQLIHPQWSGMVEVIETEFYMVDEVVDPDDHTIWYGTVTMIIVG